MFRDEHLHFGIYMFSHIQIMEICSDDLEWQHFSHSINKRLVMSRGREAGASHECYA